LPDGKAEFREISEDHKILRMSRLAVDASPRKPPSDGRDRGNGRPGPPGVPALAAVFLLAVAVRLAVSSDLSSLVLWTDPQLDARENLVWASALAQGDFRWPSPPTHGPTYPFFLAGLLRLFAGSLPAVRAAQAALGGATIVLAALLGARLFGRKAGLLTGILLAVSGPLAFVDVALWEEGLLLFLVVASLYVLEAFETPLFAALAGLLLGLAGASRPTSLLYVLAAAAVLCRRDRPRRLLSAGALVLAASAVLVPAVALSSKAAGQFVFVRSFGAINLWMGNDPAGGGVQNARPNAGWDRLAGEPYRNGVLPGGEERYFTAKTIARAAADPAGQLRVLLSKIAWLTQAEEPRDNHSFAFFRDGSRLLRVLPGFGLLAALATAGFLGLFRGRSLPLFPAAFLVAGAIPPVLALAGLRYRMPVVPVLALFSGLGAAALADAVRERRWRDLGGPALLSAVVLGATHLRAHAPSHVFAEELALGGNSLIESNRLREAEAALRKAAEADPRSGLPWELLGQLRLKEGRAAEARELLSKSLALEGDSRTARFALGQADEALGDESGALVAYRKAVEISPRFLPARYRLGERLLERGDASAAAAELTVAAAAAPAEADPLLLLAKARVVEGRLPEAVAAARRGVARAPGRADAWIFLGALAGEAADLPTLREAIERARPLAGDDVPPLVLLVARRQRLEGDPDAAFSTLASLLRRHPESSLAAEALRAAAREAGREKEARALLDALGSR